MSKNRTLNLRKDLIYPNSLVFCKIAIHVGEFMSLSLFLFLPTLQSITVPSQCGFQENLERGGENTVCIIT